MPSAEVGIPVVPRTAYLLESTASQLIAPDAGQAGTTPA